MVGKEFIRILQSRISSWKVFVGFDPWTYCLFFTGPQKLIWRFIWALNQSIWASCWPLEPRGLLKVSPLEPQVGPFKPQVTWGSNWPFATKWLKKRSNVLSWGSYVSTWGPNVITWCSNRLSWGSNVLNEGSNVLNWGSNVPTQSPNIPKFSHLFSVRTNFSHREIFLKFSQWD